MIGELFGMGMLRDWSNDEEGISPRNKASVAGFLSGVSLYATIPLALKIAKKI
jgi:hypothetical protein